MTLTSVGRNLTRWGRGYKRLRMTLRSLVLALCLIPLLAPQATATEPRTPRTPEKPTRSGGFVKDVDVRSPRLPTFSQSEPSSTPVPTVEPTPETTTAPSPVPSANSPSCSSVPCRITETWPGDDAKALRVVKCESDHVPTAYNGAGPYYGLFQMDMTFWRTYGGPEFASRPDHASVEHQTIVAWRGYQDRGWQPWPTCGKR